MGEQESQIHKKSYELYCKLVIFIRRLEFNRIKLNNQLTNNYGLQTCFIKFANKSNFIFLFNLSLYCKFYWKFCLILLNPTL